MLLNKTLQYSLLVEQLLRRRALEVGKITDRCIPFVHSTQDAERPSKYPGVSEVTL